MTGPRSLRSCLAGVRAPRPRAPARALTLGASGGAPAGHAAAGARGQAVSVGERQDADVAGGLDRRPQLQEHDVVVVVQVRGAALVLRVADVADHVPHLLPGLHAPQGMLAQVNSEPAVDTGRGWVEVSLSAPLSPDSSPLRLPRLQKHLNSAPSQTLYVKSIPHSLRFLTRPTPSPNSCSAPAPPPMPHAHASPPSPPCPGLRCAYVRLQTMRCREHPSGVDQDPPAEQPPPHEQSCLPRLRVWGAGVAAREKTVGPIGAIENLGILLRHAW